MKRRVCTHAWPCRGTGPAVPLFGSRTTASGIQTPEEVSEEAVAAAALIAAQCLGGEPGDMSYGPETPMPVFPSDLRALADEALARIASDEDGPASNWADPEDWKQWRAVLTHLRAVLAPPPPSLALFDGQP
ncbi:DUF4259 domain-containing protein [Streptomyces sp. NPDC088553]|uniref:DUF4259 domain-containing protein n=1 Tax=Streptomyces sp. NPDC088553 TaxID=3365864 RepID=UPI00380590EE